MKNTKIVRVRVIIAILIGMLLLFLIGLVIWYGIRYEKENRYNDAYTNYVCRDHHLSCINMDERAGNCTINVGSTPYLFRYGTLVDVSDEEFVFAYKRGFLMDGGQRLILQSQDNEVNVLQDWSIEKAVIYYYDCNDNRNPEHYEFATSEDFIIYEIAESKSEELFEEVLSAYLDENDINEEYIPEDEDAYKIRPKGCVYIYLRLFFEESESIVWDAKIEILRKQEDDTDILIILDKSRITEEYRLDYDEYIVGRETELYQFIWDAYMNSDISPLK